MVLRVKSPCASNGTNFDDLEDDLEGQISRSTRFSHKII